MVDFRSCEDTLTSYFAYNDLATISALIIVVLPLHFCRKVLLQQRNHYHHPAIVQVNVFLLLALFVGNLQHHAMETTWHWLDRISSVYLLSLLCSTITMTCSLPTDDRHGADVVAVAVSLSYAIVQELVLVPKWGWQIATETPSAVFGLLVVLSMGWKSRRGFNDDYRQNDDPWRRFVRSLFGLILIQVVTTMEPDLCTMMIRLNYPPIVTRLFHTLVDHTAVCFFFGHVTSLLLMFSDEYKQKRKDKVT